MRLKTENHNFKRKEAKNHEYMEEYNICAKEYYLCYLL